MLKHLANFLYTVIERYWNYTVNVGISPGMPFIEARRTKLLNLLALPCIPFMLLFAVVNACQGRYLLSALNVSTALINTGVLYLHRYRLYLSARSIMIFFSAGIYTFTGLYFHNGAQYFLLNILIFTILVYDNKWWIVAVSTLVISAFLIIVFSPQHMAVADPVPARRVWANVATSLFFIIIALSFFKHIQSDYQQEIEKQRQALAAMNKDQEKLFSIVAHDIRSPLSTLESLLDMFQKGQYPEGEMKEAAAMLYEKVSQLGDSLDNVLRWSARSMKGIRVRPTHFLLAPLVHEVCYFFQLVTEQKHIETELVIAPDLAIYADVDQVSVIMRNLISNALKFSYPGGKITVKASASVQQVVIEVTDHGMGMSGEQLANLFVYTASPGYGTSGERGTGLGLMLCKEFVQQNEGSIRVRSNPNAGSTFTVSLPKGLTINVPVVDYYN
ncbi:HAMP domain-containing histidine kinase [Chitinophaga pendula]|uniref:sensor histidine kinase n=1 Tax=Chitinophaga TaxID=79328 RepID=UPI000BB0A8CD|nr:MULTISPECIES: HAMP domain-containing sensor histidine kinase [Chitinophaga]ASZ12657.1 two-component sensor histidine kinase [Chitinophaga sp. MD30]UCJ09731.1 HAMP domain-containing histidine kinase [Chitinophaga pendula]